MRSALTRFGIRTVPLTVPAWVASATDSRWDPLPTSNTISDLDPRDDGFTVGGQDQRFLIDSWNGGCCRDGRFYGPDPGAGGHGGWAGNEGYHVDLLQEAPLWVRFRDPFEPQTPQVIYYAANEPSSRHTYHDSCFIPTLSGSNNGNKLFLHKTKATFVPSGGGPTVSSAKCAVFDFDAGAYLAEDEWPPFSGYDSGFEGCICWDNDREICWAIGLGVNRALYSFDPRELEWSGALESPFSGDSAQYSPIIAIPGTNLVVFLWRRASNQLRVYDVTDPASPTVAVVSSSGLPGMSGPSMEWEPVGQKLVVFDGGNTFYAGSVPANPQSDTWAFSAVANASGTASPSSTQHEGYPGPFSRFKYASTIGAFVYVNNVTHGGYFWKVPAGGL